MTIFRSSIDKSKAAVFAAWVLSPIFHTGLWFFWQTTAEAMAPMSDVYVRRPEWYGFIIICTWLTLFVRFFYVRIWRNK